MEVMATWKVTEGDARYKVLQANGAFAVSISRLNGCACQMRGNGCNGFSSCT